MNWLYISCTVFLGMGLGMAFGDVSAGTLIGIGAGILWSIFASKRKK